MVAGAIYTRVLPNAHDSLIYKMGVLTKKEHDKFKTNIGNIIEKQRIKKSMCRLKEWLKSPPGKQTTTKTRTKTKGTTYGKMNEWMKSSGGRDMRSGIPVTRSDCNWKEATENPEKSDFNVRFRESYNDLTQQIAYRFPNPGLPRLRQGRIGGSWRHIKEVLGHGGSRVCYVDGLVSIYDDEKFNHELHDSSSFRPHLRRVLYSPNSGFNEEAIKQGRQGGKANVSLPAVEELPMMSSNERNRKMSLQSTNKTKGHYTYTKAAV